MRAAIAAAERGDLDAASTTGLVSHPLYPWIEYAQLRRGIDALDAARAKTFLDRHAGTAAGEAFRELWLASRARQRDWAGFLAAWSATPAMERNRGLQCAHLAARAATGRIDAQWTRELQALWRDAATALPDVCDAPVAALAERGELSPALRWERIDAAAAEGQSGVMRAAARGLPADEAALANDYAAFIDAVHERALSWPKTERSRRIASYGLARLAKSSPTQAEALLPRYANALGFTDADRGRVLYPVALWTVASYEPESARRLNAVPDVAYDARLHEWRAREAMARSDWPAALAAIRRMAPAQRNDSRWQYFEARLAERTGDAAAAQRLYREAAKKPEFHGFLAADRIKVPYALCPWWPVVAPTERESVARDPAIVRAMGLHTLGRSGWAVAEWNEALSRFSDAQRRIAVDVAQDHGWFDRAVFSLGKKDPEELRLYHLRFPLHHDAIIRREAARNRIDPAWVAAEIRAESIFNPDARSGANAMGLMQVLPSTGAAVARRIGVPWRGAESLYEPETNIVLGTAYLRQLLDQYGAQPYFAVAGYNAGPAPLNRWKSQRPGMDADFWIETVSYKETRDYLARVFAFATIYDWRLNGDALNLLDRMHGRIDGPRKKFACPVPDISLPSPSGEANPGAKPSAAKPAAIPVRTPQR
ncbi:transglycosylase SLT domain-containing protein [Cognatilysobacter bugurensis]|uniref:Murein transglycosylase n=1 Tax=Cognatilysobacter bugurensis TaxID=543356 RepID=A0A918SZ53_9GAMM|nr:murein transglycosylase [Lysobacter bugurensis]